MPEGSLLRKILPPLAGAVAVLTLVVMTVGIAYMRRAVLERARLRAVTLSSIERDSLERLMRAGDHRDLQDLVDALARHPDVAAVRILRANGMVHASSHRADIGRPAGAHATQAAPSGDVMEAAIGGPVELPHHAVHTVQPFPNRPACEQCHDASARVIGFLDLDIAVNPHVTGLTAFAGLSAVLGLLYLIAVVGVAAPLVAVVVGRPVRRLMGAMERLEAGDLEVKVAPSGTRELDAVFTGFNRMVDRLRQGRAAEEEARRLALERVEQLASVGELAAGLAHEIRNPLSGVKAVLEVVARDTDDVARRAVLRDAAGELSRIDQIVRDLLQYARPKRPIPSAFDLNALVHDALTLMLPAASASAHEVQSELAASLPLVFGDAGQVRQVLVNLLLNARQAAGPDGHVVVTTGSDVDGVWCCVRDSGPGIPADRAEAIFKPFVTTKARGTGLGLPISRRMVELQGGSLRLDNPGAPGASFTMTLPGVLA